MPISIVVGAQFGSEGKGKVAHLWAASTDARVAVRVGGPNSGHTVVSPTGEITVLRQLPTAILLPETVAVLPPGSYIDVEVLLEEISRLGLAASRLLIDPKASVITGREKQFELDSKMRDRIGSTCSGVGAAVLARVSRDGSATRASDVADLRPYLADTLPYLADAAKSVRVVVEGTQGFGLSVLHGAEGDYATSRDTTAAGFLSEAGLSPLLVDQVVLVARAFPIRVAGNSGPLPREVNWDFVSASAGVDQFVERTTVTNRVRRVGEFDPSVVRRAIAANSPSHLVLNHLDYVAPPRDEHRFARLEKFVAEVESSVGMAVTFVGLDRSSILDRSELRVRAVRNG